MVLPAELNPIRFAEGCSVLVYGAFGFLCSLLTAYLCGITINPIILSEALPFLIITVGFEKPFVLARAIFTNPALTPVSSGPPFLRSRNPSSARLYPSSSTTSRVLAFGPAGSEHQDDSVSSFRSGGVRWGTPVPAKDIVNAGYDKTGRQIIRDYAIEIAVLVAGSFTGVSGLKEFCQLAAIILFFDCLFLFGFFASVLTVMVEVRTLIPPFLIHICRLSEPNTAGRLDRRLLWVRPEVSTANSLARWSCVPSLNRFDVSEL